jgi:hypothetical protein
MNGNPFTREPWAGVCFDYTEAAGNGDGYSGGIDIGAASGIGDYSMDFTAGDLATLGGLAAVGAAAVATTGAGWGAAATAGAALMDAGPVGQAIMDAVHDMAASFGIGLQGDLGAMVGSLSSGYDVVNAANMDGGVAASVDLGGGMAAVLSAGGNVAGVITQPIYIPVGLEGGA